MNHCIAEISSSFSEVESFGFWRCLSFCRDDECHSDDLTMGNLCNVFGKRPFCS